MWQAPTQFIDLVQDIISIPVNQDPAETTHVQVVRTGVITDLMLVEVFGTLEVTTGSEDDVPIFAFSLVPTDLSLSFVMRGVFGFQLKLINGETSPSGTLTARMRYRKDGINVG